MKTSDEQLLSLLRDALAETRATVRSYDTKAQIVGVGYIFALGAIGRFQQNFSGAVETNLLTVVVFWALIMLPIVLFGMVLYPSRKSVSKLSDQLESAPKRILYLDTGAYETVSALKAAGYECNPIDEVGFELLKASKLRDVKRKRFIRALISSGVAFALIFGDQFARHL